MKHLLRHSLATIVLVTSVQSANAGAPTIERFAPAGGQRGTEFTLEVVGAGFQNTSDILFYSSGLETVAVTAANDNELQIRLRATAEAAVGPHAFRLRNPQGLSELHTVHVTNIPVHPETEPNNDTAAANGDQRNIAWAGSLETGDIDCFTISLKRGERLAAEVCAVRTGGVLLDTSIKVIGPDGAQLAAVDDTPLFRQDPFVTLVAPADGRYVVSVQGTNRDGDENSRYLLSLGDFPRPAAVFPPGGQAGTSLSVQFRGDALGDFEQSLQLPELVLPHFGIIASRDGREAPSTMPFRISPFPNVLESDSRTTPASLPAAFNGVLTATGEQDQFPFTVTNRQPIEFESFAYRVGSPIDTVISIVDQDGTTLIANDDDGSHDSRLVFVPPAPGVYSLQVRDKRKSGRPDFIYRVEAAPVSPKLTAFLTRANRESQDRQTVVVPRGNRVMTHFAVQRKNFQGDVQLSTSGGPPGVLFSEARIAADRFWAPTVVEAAPESPLTSALIEVLASGTQGEQTVQGSFLQIVDLINGPADALFQSAVVDRLAVAVCEPVPFHIDVTAPTAPLAQDGTLDLELSVRRDPGFTSAVEVVLPFLPPWVDGPATVTIAPGESKALYRLRAYPKAAVREWNLCAEARATGKSSRRNGEEAMPGASTLLPPAPPPAIAVASELVRLAVQSSPVTGAIENVVTEQGAAATVTVTVQPVGELPAKLMAELEGLPNRVTASAVEVRPGDRQAQFQLQLAPDAPVGIFPDLVVRLSGQLHGQPVSYCIGRGGTLRIEPRGALVRDAQGRPLSRLEVLQKASAPTSGAGK